MSETTDTSDRDLKLAALHNLPDLPFASAYFPRTDADLDRHQEWIDSKRAWANTLTDQRVRKAYLGWIDYAQKRLEENREENRTHAEQTAREKRHQSHNEERRRSYEIATKIPKP